MDRTERVELTVLCLLVRGEEILLQNRIKEDWQGYTLPGGHVEKGESFVDAVVREMKEETGLDVINPVLCGIKQFPIEGGRYLVLLFKSDAFQGKLTSSKEGKMEWINRKDLPSLSTVKDFGELLRVIDENNLTEFLYKKDGCDWAAEIK